MRSIWQESVEIPERKRAEGVLECEVAVIGAGMTGLLTAFHLRELGKRVILLEADRIAGGQTGRTTAKITSQHGLFYRGLKSTLGPEKARLYARANQEAIDAYRRIVTERDISCDFRRLPSYLYSREDGEKLLREREAAAASGIEADFVPVRELPFSTVGAVRFENQAQFHPLRFAEAVSRELEIYEHTPVRRVQGNTVFFDGGTLRAQKIVFATHYPIVNVPGFYFLRQHQERSYVLALEGCENLEGMYYSADADGLSLRSAQGLLLLGGGSHRTGKNARGGSYAALEEAARRFYPQGRAVCRWSAQDCMPHDGLPFVGRYFYGCGDWYVATGYKKWGMSSAMAASLLLTDLIAGRKNPYEKLFTPQRHHLRAAGNLAADAAESVKGLTGGWLFPWKKREETGEKYWARCSHMGCRLEWNPDEGSWDCPCHGSRFAEDGRLLDEPARHGLEPREEKTD